MFIQLILFNINLFHCFYFDEDYSLINDLPVQDSRIVRNVVSDKINLTEEVVNNGPEAIWLEDALKDVAYYLRSHKFNEYDRRYETNNSSLKYNAMFPRPPLRNLHWEVRKYCESSFLTCVDFLWKRIKAADIKRSDDTAIAIQEQHWKLPENKQQIDAVEAECKKLKSRDNILANPFQGPLERFQWRTTASYYMCWYTMNEVSDLRHLSENCDNFANCLDDKLGPRNRDFRAKDDLPFSCATYSFCPDPCCSIKHVEEAERCWETPENPCYSTNPPGQRKCVLKHKENTDLREIILNRLNVTCNCPKDGYVWDSKYGICVDIDECFSGKHTCSKENGEACLNTPGSYKCVCKWGYMWDIQTGKCQHNEAISQIKLTVLKDKLEKSVEHAHKSLLRKLFSKLFAKSCTTSLTNSFIFTIFNLLLIVLINKNTYK